VNKITTKILRALAEVAMFTAVALLAFLAPDLLALL
jgi:hypothetical protein